MNSRALFLVIASLAVSFVRGATPREISLWPGAAPGSEGNPAQEIVERGTNGELKVSGVHHPSITPYLPVREKATGAAIIVAPGGGHRYLAIDHEGYNLARWLSERGVAAFVLKYRLARETNSTYKIETHAFADTQRALRLVRSRASEWGIDPARVGVMGFSAGGELAALVSMKFDSGVPDAADPVERQNSKPNFQVLVYPGTSGKIQPTKDAPPVFLACAANDRPDISEGLAEAYLRFKKLGVPAELHIYASGGHGFGLRENNPKPVGAWAVRLEEWMADSGLLKRP